MVPAGGAEPERGGRQPAAARAHLVAPLLQQAGLELVHLERLGQVRADVGRGLAGQRQQVDRGDLRAARRRQLAAIGEGVLGAAGGEERGRDGERDQASAGHGASR
jgi:hypothetical protein